MSLPTNYTDAVLDATQNTRRKFNLIQNSDGTVSLEDVTVYTTPGSTYGAADINNLNAQVNEDGERLDAIEDLDSWSELLYLSDITTTSRQIVYSSDDSSSLAIRRELDRIMSGEEDLLLEFWKDGSDILGVYRFKGSANGANGSYCRHTYLLSDHKGTASAYQYPNIIAIINFEIYVNYNQGTYTVKATPEYVGSNFIVNSNLNLHVYHQKKYVQNS